MSKLNQNTTTLNELLEIAQGLPEALDTSDATAEASEILAGESAYVNGEKVEGAMPNNGSVSTTFDGIDTTSVTIPEGYTSGGTVGLTSAIGDEVSEQAGLIEQISAALEGKSVGGGGSSFDTCTVTVTSFNNIYVIFANVIDENGEIAWDGFIAAGASIKEHTINNCICGSMIYFRNDYDINGYTVTNGVTVVKRGSHPGSVFRAPTTPGVHGTIDVYDDD